MPGKTKIAYYTQKIQGKFQYLDPKTQDLVNEFKSQAPDGCYKHTIEKPVRDKTHNQVKMIFGLMIQSTIEQANDLGIDVSYFLKYLLSEFDPKGQGLTKDFLHELMYVICPTTDEDGRRVTLSRMNTIQAASLFERFRNIVAPMGIVIEDPKPKLMK